ncbi:MAG: hypothetical protein FWD06_03700 [Oscillospiraceae bacterium]|nr:hypothetical protein [Oscillospiraceae bacterium]
MFKKSLALLLGALIAFSFAMVASAETYDYSPVAIEEFAEAELVPDAFYFLDGFAEVEIEPTFIYVPEFNIGNSFWCGVVAILGWPLNFIGINMGRLAAWLTDVGAVEAIGTGAAWLGTAAAAVTIVFLVINIIQSFGN